MVWASFRSILDKDWVEVLSRISEKPLQEVFKMMQTCFLERNPLITRKLAALRITEPKEEQISDCTGQLRATKVLIWI